MKNTLDQTFLKAEIQTDIGKIFKRLEKEIKADEQNEGHVSDAQFIKGLWESDIDESYDKEQTLASITLLISQISSYVPKVRRNVPYILELVKESNLYKSIERYGIVSEDDILNEKNRLSNAEDDPNDFERSELARLRKFNMENDIKLQRNVITYRDYITQNGRLSEIDDDTVTHYADTYNAVCNPKEIIKKNFDRLISCICGENRFNPIELFFKSLPVYEEGMHDYIGELHSIITSDTRPISLAVFRKFAYQCYALATEERPRGAEGTLVLLNPNQGIGKSLFANLFFCSSYIHKKYNFEAFTILNGFNPNNKDKQIESTELWGAEISELGERILNVKTLQNFKTFITEPSDRFRLPYGRRFVDRPRRTNYICTTNNDEFLVDDKDRRFYVIRTRDNPFAQKLFDFDREGNMFWFWAQVKYESDREREKEEKGLLEGNTRYYGLTPSEKDEILVENQQYRRKTNAEIIIRDLFAFAEEHKTFYEWGYWLITDLYQDNNFFDTLRTVKVNELRKAIKIVNEGNTKHSREGTVYYFPRMITQHR